MTKHNGDSPGSQSAVAGMAWIDIARTAYNAYGESVGWKAHTGKDMPTFMELPKKIQVAWEAAVRHVMSLEGIPTEHDLRIFESRWAGWESPSFDNEF